MFRVVRKQFLFGAEIKTDGDGVADTGDRQPVERGAEPRPRRILSDAFHAKCGGGAGFSETVDLGVRVGESDFERGRRNRRRAACARR